VPESDSSWWYPGEEAIVTIKIHEILSEHMKIHLKFFIVKVIKHHSLSREAVEAPSMEMFKTQMDVIQGSLL